MQIHQMIKNVIGQHKKKIELTQWAIISGVSSLVYSEYIRRIKQKTVPIRAILVPEVRAVQELLDPEGNLMKILSEQLIDRMSEHELIQEYSHAPELVLFKDDQLEILKTLFDLYIIPNIVRKIPETISMKFGLNNPKQQLIRQDRTIDLFNRQPINEEQFQFVVDQTVLQLVLLMPTMKKSIEIPEDNAKIFMTKKEILTIGNENAICPIHINEDIINNKNVMKLLSFVTNTNISKLENKTIGVEKNGNIVEYIISTNVFNQVGLITLEGIKLNTEAD